ncbi:molybdate ABC transporter substrate-binding protein [Pelagibius sp. Alg239-R121]|uniref:molybdate ABC transporter substrate-binding protein n=1 Tax=Pelagibius sp. Alg239-R121 TaxID=2993448 RepID=UPI0024A73CAA|nr:molybdate ABC transporter substrate-binding protein [Pelagibius sp. Alg239-R121]
MRSFGLCRARRFIRGAVFPTSGLLASIFLSVSSHAGAPAKPVTLFAAASTTNAVTEIVQRYNAQNGPQVRTVFAASSTLAKQIANGAPADLFLSANQSWMDYLGEKSALKTGSEIPVLSNRLVLVTANGHSITEDLSPAVIERTLPLEKILGSSRLALGNPHHVPAGIYAKAALQNLDLWEPFKDKLAFSGSVRTALALVERGEAAAGIVYQTDALIASKLRVVGMFAEDSHPPIVYPLAIVANYGGRNTDAFYGFLQSPEALEVFERHGFSAPKVPK